MTLSEGQLTALQLPFSTIGTKRDFQDSQAFFPSRHLANNVPIDRRPVLSKVSGGGHITELRVIGQICVRSLSHSPGLIFTSSTRVFLC
jgi:hypothetical protein